MTDSKVKQAWHDLPTPEPESPVNRRRPHRFSTLCATVENPAQKDQYGSSSVPIYQSATFKGVDGQYDYSRSGNPTRSHLEHHIAKISAAAHAFAVSSGMAALDVILRLLKPGDEIITGDDLYGGTNRLLSYIRVHGGITVHHVDTTDTSSIIPFIDPTKTAMVLLESPTNPLLKVADLAAISKEVKERAPDVLVIVDNTMMSPYLQRPLIHGADIVYDSATKYLSGHHDLMAGVITCNSDEIAKKLAFTINAIGNALTPNDSFLLLRGIKTLAVRMDRQQHNASLVASYLASFGFRVHYPGLPNHPGREIHQRIADGDGAVLSFETGSKALSEKIVGATRLWGISVSFGCVNSLISMPCVMSHASIDAATRAARGLPEDLIRLCVGIEDSTDLLEDLECALIEAGAIAFDAVDNKLTRVSPRTEDSLTKAVQKLVTDSEPVSDWFVSAPGKVILFGEHAVVHGVTAIAAAVDLRCYGLISARQDHRVSLRFNDVGNFYHEWDIDALPWGAATSIAVGDSHPEFLDPKLLSALNDGPLSELNEDHSHAKAACLAFLYLYLSLAVGGKRPAVNFTTRSTLPVSAGLGSSASFSACIAAALLLVYQRTKVPPIPAASSDETGHVNASHQGRKALTPDIADQVNHWAFVSEKILHGNPSGVDNSVAVFGGALSYTRAGFNRKSGMESIQGFKSLRFLLTNSKVPRDTKKLVAGVGKKKMEEPEVVDKLLDSIQNISDEARRALADPQMDRSDLLLTLSALIRENHGYLISLGVSHPALEDIRSITSAAPYNLSTKLTGAGGGGCAVTLVPDDFADAELQQLLEVLSSRNFDPYLTSVGGGGLGILSPYPEHRKAGISPGTSSVTPPETPTSVDHHPLRSAFELQSIANLPAWANEIGKWLYV